MIEHDPELAEDLLRGAEERTVPGRRPTLESVSIFGDPGSVPSAVSDFGHAF